jgi:hypothetical protein
MTTYNRQTSSQPLKWLIALIVFMLAMGFTTSEVAGLTVPSDIGWHGTAYEQPNEGSSGSDANLLAIGAADRMEHSDPITPDNNDGGDDDQNPEPVPEPGTIILLSMGLGGAWLAARKLS